jgi:3',5'-cyclic-AMP phosphodiesterase
MSKLTFAQISDTHFRKVYSKESLHGIFADGKTPGDILVEVLSQNDLNNLDFVIFSGDLIHEGSDYDYEAFDQIVKKYIHIPYYYVLGNHDKKEAFYRGVYKISKNDSYYYTDMINGYRMIVLDSSLPDKHSGDLTEEQVEWFCNVTKDHSPNGSLLFIHHPFTWFDESRGFQTSTKFNEALQSSDVIGIFCGHLHQFGVNHYLGIPQINAESLAFGTKYTSEQVSYTNRFSFNHVHVVNDKVNVQPILVSPIQKDLLTINKKEFLKIIADK